jgi:hypothetical protein
MGKFTSAPPPAPVSAVTTIGTTATHQGGAGYTRDIKSELFLLAVTNMVGEDTFYEKADKRDDRFLQLVHAATKQDPDWVASLVPYLRGVLNMRSAAIVTAAESALARRDGTNLEPTVPVRKMVSDAMLRADEPAEFIAYWKQRTRKATLPGGVQRGVADAVARLYTERAALKYDGTHGQWRMADVVPLAKPTPVGPWQADLFDYLADRRYRRETVRVTDRLPVISAYRAVMAMPAGERRAWLLEDPARLRAAGMTWEELSSLGPMDRGAWEAVIPSMGYMALLRNLRNFDEAGVSDEVAERVARKLADPQEVARSRQLPMRFYSAYVAAPSLRWGHALEKALTAALANVPALPGRTLVLVDTSTSMNEGFSKDGTVKRWDAAALFGIALGQRCASADVVSFSSMRRYWGDRPAANTKAFPLARGESLLRAVGRWRDGGWFLGGGTDTALALREEFAGHDRVVIVTDEQAGQDYRDVSESIPASVPMYTWNLAGYRPGHAPSGGANRHTFGGLTDAAFRMVPLLEAGRNGAWPWEA